MPKVTKGARRALARSVRENLSLYLIRMTPDIESYCADKGYNASALRLQSLQAAKADLDQLLILEQQS